MFTSYLFRIAFASGVLMALALGLTACEVRVSPLGSVPGGATITISGTATPSGAPAPAPTAVQLGSTGTSPDDGAPAESLTTDVESVVALVNVNIRSGPGLNYEVVSFLPTGQSAAVQGVSQDGGWWSVLCPDNTLGCWIVNEPGLTQPVGAPAIETGAGTAATPAPAQDAGEATVETLEVRTLESFPVQVQAVVTGTLPDACAFVDGVQVLKEEETNFRIRLTIAWRDNQRCAPMSTPFEEIVPLDVVGLPAGDYEVRINGLVESFSLAVDNETVPTTPGS